MDTYFVWFSFMWVTLKLYRSTIMIDDDDEAHKYTHTRKLNSFLSCVIQNDN